MEGEICDWDPWCSGVEVVFVVGEWVQFLDGERAMHLVTFLDARLCVRGLLLPPLDALDVRRVEDDLEGL